MDNLIKNSNLATDIGRKITNLLEMESLQSCRLANSSMKNMVDDPRFWLQKLDKKGLSKEHLIKWRKLINVVENTDLEENITKCLMKMYQNFSKWAQAPIHIASKAGEASLVKIILEKIDSSMEKNEFGNTPMILAAGRGFFEVVKTLITFTDIPNAPANDGVTPIHIATQNGHVQIVKMLMATTETPNTPEKNHGWTPIHLAALNGHVEILKFLMATTHNPNAPDNNGRTTISLISFRFQTGVAHHR